MHTVRKFRRISAAFFLLGMMWLCMSGAAAAAKKPAKPAKVTGVKISVSGASSHKLKWKKVSKATCYQIYCKDYSLGETKYKRIRTLKGASKTSYTVKNRKQGKAYAYVIRAYRQNSAGKSYGQLSDPVYGYIPKKQTVEEVKPSETEQQETTASAGLILNPTKKQKCQLVFGVDSLKEPRNYYKTDSEAKKNMQSVTVRTWDFADKTRTTKITRTWTIEVHKNLAATVQQIFEEIYNGQEQFPIHELGGFRTGAGKSEHKIGTAIDINWTENYMVNIATGQITAGKFWKPGEDPYSIPKDGEVARIFKKYGFSQGDWGNSKDYMHFSYFGT